MSWGLGPTTVALAAALVASSVLGTGTGAGIAAGAPGQSPPQCSFDYCVGDQLPGPRTPAPGDTLRRRPTRPAGTASGAGNAAPPPVCTWVPWTDATSAFPVIPDPPSGQAELWAERCDGRTTGRVRWVQPGQPGQPAPTPLTPAQLAARIRVRLEGNLPRPTVISSPAPGVAALVGFPSFVAVDNWRPRVTDRECDPNFPLCVSVAATPQLEWAPGEPGAATVACAGAGTRFDPAAGDPEAQAAAPGACAYAYRSRTGVAGRPGEWAGQVTVRWVLRWRSTTGNGGALPDVTKTAAVPRAVDEVQTLVESAG